ncbi:MAG: TfoX/Sxy family protein [Beduini sp.]|uniref:TfoX/Sxy family protein n=2 Tax=Beduini sp. TaxID=1922300 RepID=UPI0011C9EA97
MKLLELPNIGKETARQLEEVGIHDAEELRLVGGKEAWLRIKTSIDPGACIHLLYGIEAAVEGIKKKDLNNEKKEELKEFYHLNE